MAVELAPLHIIIKYKKKNHKRNACLINSTDNLNVKHIKQLSRDKNAFYKYEKTNLL